MIREILIAILLLIMFYSAYKIGYLRSEIKFIAMVKFMVERIDPASPMAEYNIEFIEMIRKEFERDRGS